MKRIKNAVCLQTCIILAMVMLLSACAADKRAQPHRMLPDNTVHIAESKAAKLEITGPSDLGFMVRDACAGRACGLIANAEKQVAAVPTQHSFPADKPAPESESEPDRQAGAAATADDSDDVETVKPKEGPNRTLPVYERK